MKQILSFLTVCAMLAGILNAADPWIVYPGGDGPGKGKHIVLLAGDEEYRSEEGLPMLGKILSQRHGFKCTVSFSVNEQGVIDPNNQKSLSNPKALDSADAIIMLLRFRTWSDEDYKHFDDACNRGIPILGLRTSTHAFRGKHGGFGKRVLGEKWVSHWGGHKREACRGVIEPSAKDNPILNGVTDIFADSDVYEAYPPKDASILVRGLVLENMKPDSKPSTKEKKGRGINDPAMPVAWTRKHKWPSGKTSNIFNTTMGAATDLKSEGVRRLVVNALFDGIGLQVPKKANVDYVDPYKPLFYGFNSFRKGIKPSDHAIGKVLPQGKK
ncbi:MAG: hypothetical protein HOD72_11355 [Opitutae bacterium]|jgi:type 1 glutamine amidotransferase|nr:hypothetical protein [Opitutae bacterium]MBT4225051.1 hypothetical protein [Opitutae bacterium]MBT5379541.1 hypothetical protein [Opitutae bacterium]MBT5690843.1 hypothetical protein [Opitutae bacterium]MBT6463868.1 hypothetical protein [Opitutae bacterium]